MKTRNQSTLICLNDFSSVTCIWLILEGFLEKDGTLKSCARKNNISDEEYDNYFEIMVQQKIVTIIENGKVRIEEVGMQILFDELLHCKCNRAYPIVWIVPDYVEVDQESVDRFNKQYWNGLDEYKKYLLEIKSEEKKTFA